MAASARIVRPPPWRTACTALVGLSVWCGLAGSSFGGPETPSVTVAVAANFLAPLQALEQPFQQATGSALKVSAGSTGVLYAQIKAGAPIDVFLSADQERPRLLEQEGLAVPGSRFAYAQGVLVLWSQNAGLIQGDGALVLRGGEFAHLALANPETAPYGLAARQALQALGLWDGLQPKLVRGQSVSQTMQFIASGNAELGFLALSQVRSLHMEAAGSTWLVPDTLYQPILQDLVVLKAAPHPAQAREFVVFLRSPAARQRIEAMGYRVPGS